MKKIFSVLLTCSLSAAIVSNASAQVFASHLTFASPNTSSASASMEAAKNSKAASKAEYKAAKSSMKAYKANLRATSDFGKEFTNVPEPKWFTETKTITASFNESDVKTAVVYNKKGHRLHTMSIYRKDKLPADVSRLMRNNYGSYEITQVQDIKEGRIQFYVIHLEDKNSYKQVCVYNGEVGVISEFGKAL